MDKLNDDKNVLIMELIQKDKYTISYIADKINSSERTIRNYIKSLSNELEKIAIIHNEKGVINLIILDYNKFDEFMTNLKDDSYLFSSKKMRISYIFKELINTNGFCIIDEMAYEMNISRSTIIKDIKTLKEICTSHNIKINGTTGKGIEICANELNIRSFILTNIYDALYKDYCIDDDILTLIDDILLDIGITSNNKNNIKKYIIVVLDRFLNNYHITNLDDNYNDILQKQGFSVSSLICNKLEKYLNIKIPQNERIFIALPIICMQTPINLDEVKNIIIPSYIKNIVKDIQIEIKKELNLSINILESNNEDFLFHMNFMINRINYNVKVKNPILDEMRNKYLLAYEISKISAKIIQRNYNILVCEDELGYLCAYFQVYLLENNIYQKDKTSILVICYLGKITSRLVIAQLKNILDNNYTYDTLDENDICKINLDKYDIIISLVKINIITNTSIIYITEIFDEKILLSQIENAKYLSKLDKYVSLKDTSLITNVITNDTFFILDDTKCFIQNITKMIDDLIEKNIVDKEFKQSVLLREKKSTTIFNRYIAFPHAINKKNDKIRLCIGIFKNTRIEKDKEIKLIFLFILPEHIKESEDLLIKIYDEIIFISKRDDIINSMCKVNNYSDFLTYLVKLGNIFDKE